MAFCIRQWFRNIIFHINQRRIIQSFLCHSIIFIMETLRKFFGVSGVRTEKDMQIFRRVQFGKTPSFFFISERKHFSAFQVFLLITYTLCQYHHFPDKRDERLPWFIPLRSELSSHLKTCSLFLFKIYFFSLNVLLLVWPQNILLQFSWCQNHVY